MARSFTLTLCNAVCGAGSSRDAELLQRVQVMEETHRLTVQEMMTSHNNELEQLKTSLQYGPHTQPVSDC